MPTPFNNPDWHALTAGTTEPRILCGWLEDNGYDDMVEFADLVRRGRTSEMPRNEFDTVKMLRDLFGVPFGDQLDFERGGVFATGSCVMIRVRYKRGTLRHGATIRLWMDKKSGLPAKAVLGSHTQLKPFAAILAGFGAGLQIEVNNSRSYLKARMNDLCNYGEITVSKHGLKYFEPYFIEAADEVNEKTIQYDDVVIVRRDWISLKRYHRDDPPDRFCVSDVRAIGAPLATRFFSALAQVAYQHEQESRRKPAVLWSES